VNHGGIESMTMRTPAHAWVVRAKKLAKSIKGGCFTCRRRAKVRETQKMAPLPEHRMGPAPVFESTAVDLFGPITFQDTINKRGNGKAWGVVFVCTATSLMHVEVTDAYSTDSFLLAVRRFMAIQGAPSRSSRTKERNWWQPLSRSARGTGQEYTRRWALGEQNGT
jgi:hypothetical protein